MSEQKTVAFGAIGMMHDFDHAMPRPRTVNTSGSQMVRRVLLVGMVTCRTSSPSVKHMVKANVPGGGPVGMALDKAMSVAIATEYLRTCAAFYFAWRVFDFRPTEGNASGMRRTQRTLSGEKQP